MALQDELRYGTEKHRRTLEAILSYRNFSAEKMRNRYSTWIKQDEAAIAFMPEKDSDRRRKALRDAGEPQFTTLKVPYDYAVLMSYHTYVTSVFLGRSPVIQYQGRTGQSQNATMAVESIIDYQMQVGRMLPQLYVWLLDAEKYGVGFVGNYWDKRQMILAKEVEVEDTFLGVGLGTTHKEMQRQVLTEYEGNCLYNIRPYDSYPDPRVTFTNIQNGEFWGRLCPVGWNYFVKGVANGLYFNEQVVRDMRNGTIRFEEGSPNIEYPVRPGDTRTFARRPANLNGLDLLEMYIELVPREWALGDSSYPEKWAFAVANDTAIVAAQPMGHAHNRFPVSVLEGEIEGYSMFKRGMMETIGPLTDVMTWLFNTHFYNTRKALNDMFVVDPSKVVLKDLLDPRPGKLIRLKEEMYGQDVRTAITQFPVTDVTQLHMQDAQAVSQLIQRVSGVNDNIMGLVNAGGRKTATEVRTSSTFGINRLKTLSEWFSATGWSDLAQLLLQSTQQMMSTPMKVRLAGDVLQYPGAARSVIEVSPQDIAGFYDFVPVDGTLPVDRFAQVSLWSQMLSQMAQAPQVLMQYDLGKIFAFVAQLAGLKNINQFRIDIQSPTSLAQQAQAGNVIPIGGGSGMGRGNAAGQRSPRPRSAGEPPVTPAAPGVAVAA